MAIVKATYTRSRGGAKAAIRYIEHRPGREGEKVSRELYGIDGVMERPEAYQMIDAAEKGSVFFRIVISPDPETEDREKDLHLAELTRQTMLTLEERLKKEVPYVAVEHNTTATEAALFQRQERDQVREQHRQQQEGLQWAG